MSKFLHSVFAVAAGVLLTFSMSAAAQTSSSQSMPGEKGRAAEQSGPIHSNDKSAQKKGKSADEGFMKKAAEGGLAEVELGQLALQKASSDEVKKFAQKMVDDHSKANDELKEVAANQGVALPDKPGMKERAERKRLEHASGPKFDQAYMDHMVKDHNNDVNEFRKESQNGKDSAVKDFALKTLPKLEEHLKLAQEVQGKVKSAKNEGAPPASETAKDSSKPKY